MTSPAPSARYPAELLVEPLAAPQGIRVAVPGSKSITNRAVILAALTARDRPCLLRGFLHSEDTEVMLAALRQLGFVVEADETAEVRIARPANASRIIPASSADLFLANSGTSVRFLTAMVALGEGTYRLDGIARMRERPIGDLLDALARLGVGAISESGNGCPPVRVTTSGMRGGDVRIRADLSSQFLSGLMLAAPFAREAVRIHIDGDLVSEPYVTMTARMLESFGLKATPSGNTWAIAPWSGEQILDDYTIEPDASTASYFLAMPAILGGSLTVANLGRDSLQGDVAFADALARMGCDVTYTTDGISVRSTGTLRGIDIDMNAISDTVMTLGAVACFAEGPTAMRNIAHIRHKETDRIAALANELRKLGATVTETRDSLTIVPGPLRSARVATYNDHRMAMSLALIGLRQPGVTIENPGCVSKTYPRFWDDLDALRRR